MLERWASTDSALLISASLVFYITPYILFYIGLGFRYGAESDNILTAARFDK